MKLAELMTTNVLTIREDMPFTEACRLMQQMGIHHLPVVDHEDRLIGIFTASDALGAYNEHIYNRIIRDENVVNDLIKLKDIMTDRKVYKLDLDARPEYALTLMKEFDIHSIPVVDGGRLVGLVTSTDILNKCKFV